MTAYIVHDASGEILRAGHCPPDMVGLQASEPGESVLEAEGNDADHYIDVVAGTVEDRQAMAPSVVNSTGQADLSGLPDPCTVRCNGAEVEATGGVATITFDVPGDYTIELEARPQYLDHSLEVTIP